MKKFLLSLLFVGTSYAVALALPRVDIGDLTTNAEGMASIAQALAWPAWTYVGLRAVIALASALKAIFPHIDGK